MDLDRRAGPVPRADEGRPGVRAVGLQLDAHDAGRAERDRHARRALAEPDGRSVPLESCRGPRRGVQGRPPRLAGAMRGRIGRTARASLATRDVTGHILLIRPGAPVSRARCGAAARWRRRVAGFAPGHPVYFRGFARLPGTRAMDRRNLQSQLPTGVKIYLPDEAARLRGLQERLLGVFRLWGYREVMTPTFEFFDVLALGTDEAVQEGMFKFVDRGHGADARAPRRRDAADRAHRRHPAPRPAEALPPRLPDERVPPRGAAARPHAGVLPGGGRAARARQAGGGRRDDRDDHRGVPGRRARALPDRRRPRRVRAGRARQPRRRARRGAGPARGPRRGRTWRS